MIVEDIDHWVVTLKSPKHGTIKMYCGENEDYAYSIYDAMVLDADPNEKVSKELETFSNIEIDIFNFLIEKGWKWFEVGESELLEINSNFPHLTRTEVSNHVENAYEGYRINYTV